MTFNALLLGVPLGAGDCEAVSPGILGQPANTLSSLAFVVVGLWLVARGRRAAGDGRWRLTALGVASVAAGLGSVAYHGPMPVGASTLHDIGLFAPAVVMAAIEVAARRGALARPSWPVLAPTLAVAAAILLFRPAGGIVLAVLAVAVASLAMVSAWRRGAFRRTPRWRPTATFGVFGALAPLAYVSGRTGSSWCDPTSPWQLHAVWHVLAAVALGAFAVAAYDRRMVRGTRPPAGEGPRATLPQRGDGAQARAGRRRDGPSETGRNRHAASRVGRWALLVVPLGAVAYTLLLTAPGFDEAGSALGELRPLAIGAAAVGAVVTVLSLAQVYRACLAAVGTRLRFLRALNVSMSAFTVTQVIPGGGAVGGVVAARRMIAYGAPRAAGAAAVALMGTLTMLTLGAIVSVGLLTSLASGQATLSLVVAVGAVLIVLVLATRWVVVVIRTPSRGNRVLDLVDFLVGRFGIRVQAWRASLDEVASSPPTTRALGRIVAWSAANWLADAAALWAVFAGLGEFLDPAVLLLGFGVAQLAVMIPISPGGLGLVEAGMAGTFSALGVPSGTAVTAVLAYRVVSYWLPLMAGVPVYLRGARNPESELA